MIKTYRYIIHGTANGGQTWKADGIVTCEYCEVFNKANREAFHQLTQGKARYGFPGLGCHGPYATTRVLITLIQEPNDGDN